MTDDRDGPLDAALIALVVLAAVVGAVLLLP